MKNTPSCHQCEFRKQSIFKHCEFEEIEFLDKNKYFQKYKKGQVIFLEGNSPFGLFCLVNGKVKISRMGFDGKEQIIRLAKPGDTLGYRSLIKNTRYTASAIALDDAQACFITKDDFNSLISHNSKISSDLLEMLAEVLGDTQDKFINLATKPVKERLAEALLLLKSTYENNDEDLFSISISREDLAAIVGTVKETVTRCLSEFKNEHMILTKGSNITILQPDKLLKLSNLYD